MISIVVSGANQNKQSIRFIFV